MADFDLDAFVGSPTVEVLNKSRKEDLVDIAAHYKIAVSKQWRKLEIRSTVARGLEELGVLKLSSDGGEIPSEADGRSGEEERGETAEVETSEAKVAFSPSDPFSPGSVGSEGGGARLKVRLARMQVEARERAESRRLEADMKFRLEIRRLEIEAETQIKLRALEIRAADRTPVPGTQPSQSADAGSVGTTFEVSRHISLVPQFRETEVDSYFNVFERIASTLQWPKEVWSLLLQCKLTGKAQDVFATLSLEDSVNYEAVKAAILRAYELVPEAYRQRFRSHKKNPGQSFVEFAREKSVLFDKWCTSSKVNDLKDMRELILLEEFKNCVPERVVVYMNEQKVTSVSQASVLADEFTLTHKNVFVPTRSERVTSFQASSSNSPYPKTAALKSKEDRECYYCHKPGHLIAECFGLKRKQSNSVPKSAGFVKLVAPVDTDRSDQPDSSYAPFLLEGAVSVTGNSAEQIRVKMLRDTGAMQSFICADVLPFSEQTFCGSHVLVQGIEMGLVQVPLHQIHLESKLCTGLVKVAVRESLPVSGVQLILGNDLAGGKVMPLLEVFNNPVVSDQPDELAKSFPETFPVCVVTRAQSRKTEAEDLATSFISPIFLSDMLPDASDKAVEKVPGSDTSGVKLSVTRERVIAAQHEDRSLQKCIAAAVSAEKARERKTAYFMENGLLMRKWCSDVADGAEWTSVYQIVIPSCYRQQVLSLAHDHDLSGHLGIKKTYYRVLRHFFWPRLKTDVTRFCRTCRVCQITGKPNQVIPCAPLVPIPAVGEPFEHVIVDCVGPLPKSKAGNQFLLTIMCTATRFPEAIPLRKITAPVVTRALVKFFSTFGLPKVVQSDQGTNFLSKIFTQVLSSLNISHRIASAYHAESQGALERFHQTLKSMLRKYCMETSKEWDEGVPLLLFAIRETVQESLGFSPAELVFGHTVRGPLKMLKEDLMSSGASPSLNVLDYVSKFRERLHKACSVAKESLEVAQRKMKRLFDRKSVQRSFNEGDQVLVLLPMVGSALSARFSGPYEVVRKLSNTDYVIGTPDRKRKTRVCHVNMLKTFYCREGIQSDVSPTEETAVHLSSPAPASVACAAVEISNPDDDDDGVIVRHTYQQCARLKNSEVLSDLSSCISHLSEKQGNDVVQLINDFPALLNDVPSRTTVLEHDINVGDAVPVKQHAYRMNSVKRERMRGEVEYLVEHGLAQASCSPWSSPCLLIPKSDGTDRFCTDYRKVNALTVPDCFPLPRMEDCIDNIGSARYVSKLDLLKGYWQVPLTSRASDISAFVTPDSFLQYSVMAFGMRNAPATFQRLVNRVLSGVPKCNAYLDDLVVYSSDWPEHIALLRTVFERLQEGSLTLNLAKCEFGQATITYLGKEVGHGQVRPIEAKVTAISEFPAPATRRELRRFLGMAGYYRSFCKNFSTIAQPLTSLLSPSRTFLWSTECEHAFNAIKDLLCNAPVLAAPDFDSAFKLDVDASYVGAGAVLIQGGKDGIDHPVCYFSRKFNKHQLNYSTIEKEALALLMALQHFDVYVGSSISPVTVFTDHNPLVFLSRMYNQNQRLMRWALIVQGYNLIIKHKRGVENVIADALSRVASGGV